MIYLNKNSLNMKYFLLILLTVSMSVTAEEYRIVFNNAEKPFNVPLVVAPVNDCRFSLDESPAYVKRESIPGSTTVYNTNFHFYWDGVLVSQVNNLPDQATVGGYSYTISNFNSSVLDDRTGVTTWYYEVCRIAV